MLRNAGKTLPLIGVIVLAVMLITSIVSLMDSIPLSIRTTYDYIRSFVAVTPRGDPARAPLIKEKFDKECPIPLARLIVCRGAGAQVNSIVGKLDFVVFGIPQKDMEFYLERLNIQGRDGRLPKAGEAAAVISDPVAKNLKLKIGDSLLKPSDQDMYSPYEVKVVGIVHSKEWIMMSDIEYLQANHFPPVDNILAYAKDPADQPKLDAWAKEAFKGQRSYVFTYASFDKDTTLMFQILYAILNVVIFLLVSVITIMMGMLINIFQTQRLVEFGLLQALGYTRKQLIQRVLLETGLVLVVGWIFGLALSMSVLELVKVQLFEPNAFSLQSPDRNALLYTIPVPISIAVVAFLTIRMRFRRFDPVGVVERRLV